MNMEIFNKRYFIIATSLLTLLSGAIVIVLRK